MLRLLTGNILDRRNFVKTLKLREISELKTGPFGTQFSAKEYVSEGIPVINVKNIGYGNIISEGLDYVGNSTLERLSEHKLKTGDIVFGRKGSVDRHCLITKEQDGWMQGSDCIRVRLTDASVYSNFISYYLLTDAVKTKINNSAVGSTMASLNTDILGDVDINLPCYEEQYKIASVLSTIDQKIEKNKEINDYLEQQALLIFSHMFQNISYGLNYVGDYITPKRGKALLSKDAIPGCVPVIAGGLVPATYHNMANTVAPVLTISGSGANAGYVNIWHDPVWSSDSSYIDYKMTPNVYFWYAFLKLRQQDIFDIQTGSAQPHIYPKHIAELSIGDIDNFKVESYTSQVTPLFAKIGANVRENKELQQLRDWLLPMLMNGQATIED